MTRTTTPTWEKKRTDETRLVETVLREAGFGKVDAYRYNSAAIRVRVIDPRFEGLSDAKRDALVEKHLKTLPERTQADIISLFTFAPSELDPKSKFIQALLMNEEFTHPSPSRL